MIAYHATGAEFDRFDTSRGDLGPHFGSLQQAVHVVRRRAPVWPQPRILRVQLNIVRPLLLKDEGSFHADGIAIQLAKKGLLPMRQAREITSACDKDFRLRKLHDPQLLELIRKAGFDGVGYSNRHEGLGRSLIAFDADQIRIDAVLLGPALRAIVFDGEKVLTSDWLPALDSSKADVSKEVSPHEKTSSKEVGAEDPCCDCKQFPRFRG
jgi:hypothetical protein